MPAVSLMSATTCRRNCFAYTFEVAWPSTLEAPVSSQYQVSATVVDRGYLRQPKPSFPSRS